MSTRISGKEKPAGREGSWSPEPAGSVASWRGLWYILCRQTEERGRKNPTTFSWKCKFPCPNQVYQSHGWLTVGPGLVSLLPLGRTRDGGGDKKSAGSRQGPGPIRDGCTGMLVQGEADFCLPLGCLLLRIPSMLFFRSFSQKDPDIFSGFFGKKIHLN